MYRQVTVDIPDNDAAENAVRRIASTLRDGFEVASIPIPSNLGMPHAHLVGQVIFEAQTKLDVLGAIVKREAEQQAVAV